jgi:hypothetical protein
VHVVTLHEHFPAHMKSSQHGCPTCPQGVHAPFMQMSVGSQLVSLPTHVIGMPGWQHPPVRQVSFAQHA